MTQEHARWWEPFRVEGGMTLACAIGPLTLFLCRDATEWRLWSERSDAGDAEIRTGREPIRDAPGMEGAERFMFRDAPETVLLHPVLADRPVVVRPRYPTAIPPGEAATFYISTPVSVTVGVGEAGVRLCEIPSLCMSDTWFGPNTREGELCYATPTQARSRLDEVPRRPHRAITPVQVKNDSSGMLTIEKLSLPVPFLSVYGRPDGSLWTQAVTLTQHVTEGALASLRVGEGAPPEADGAALLTASRRTPERGGLVRAFSGLFGGAG